jgi:hypothetical protein
VLSSEALTTALQTLGEVLEGRGQSSRILVVGGSSLLLLGLIDRPTADLDVIGTAVGEHYVRADAIPEPLATAARDVGAALGLGADWINAGPSSLFDFGLPNGFESRVSVRLFGSLEVHIAGRYDLICFKLYAAVDHSGQRLSKHFLDLQDMTPTDDELFTAARWTRTHDPSEGFLRELVKILRSLGLEVSDGDL